MGSLAVVTTDKTARLGPALTPLRVDYERLDPATSNLALPAPVLQIICPYAVSENHLAYDLDEYISGDWQASVFLGAHTGRIGAISVEIPASPHEMKVRLQAMFQRALVEDNRETVSLNCRLIEDTLDLRTFAQPGHWLLDLMFPK